MNLIRRTSHISTTILIFFLLALTSTVLCQSMGAKPKLISEDSVDAKTSSSPTPTPTPTPGHQERLRRFEVGIQATTMFQSNFDIANVVNWRAGLRDSVYKWHRYESGLGARFTYNVSRRLAVEAEVNYIPSTPSFQELIASGTPIAAPSSGGEKTQILVGVKYGIRRKHFGVFAKARPGLIHFTAFESIDAKFVAHGPNGEIVDILLLLTEKPATFFNMDIGGVFEYYPTKRTIIRFDMGDTIIRYNGQRPKDINPTFIRHNLQGSIGFGFRF